MFSCLIPNSHSCVTGIHYFITDFYHNTYKELFRQHESVTKFKKKKLV